MKVLDVEKVPFLITDRLLLRGIEEDDTDFIVEIRSNPDIYQYFLYPHKITKEEHLSWYRSKYMSSENIIDWIALTKTNENVGIFGIKREMINNRIEISYILHPSQYGKGYAREAVERIINYAWKIWGVKQVTAEIHKSNIKSINFIEHFGFHICECKGPFVVYLLDISSVLLEKEVL